MTNDSLGNARKSKNDEFYTVYDYIQKEMNAYLEYNPDVFRDKIVLLPCDDPEWSNFTKYFAQNFEMLGLKKLISTSYALDCKKRQYEKYHQISFFELNSDLYDATITDARGKIFTLDRSRRKRKAIDIDDLEWKYLEGDGDFRSDEVKALRDEADIIVTNPPFSLFREFVAWVFEAGKSLVVIGNQNAITYKEIFPLLKENKLWIGATNNGQDMVFEVPEGANIAQQDREKAAKLGYVGNYTRLGNACWFTNIDHGRRHQPLALMTMADNLKFSKHKSIREQGYLKYDNYDAIEVPFVDAIPSDYYEDMGVPITYLQRHNPEQFEVVKFRKGDDDKDLVYSVCSQFVNVERERERERRQPDSAAVLPNYHQAKDVAELWACRSHSSPDTTQSNLRSSDLLPEISEDLQEYRQRQERTDRISAECCDTVEFSSRKRCNGVMGVPITFLEKYNPEQFEILGITLGNTVEYEMTKIYENAIQHNKDGTTQGGSKVNTRAAIRVDTEPVNAVYYTADDTSGFLLSIYPRILIRWR